MAGQRLTDKSALANNPASDDLLMVVDVSDTTGSADGTSKKVISDYVVATERISINNASFLQLPTTGQKLVNKRGANTIIMPISVIVQYSVGGTPNTSSVKPTIGYVDQSSNEYWDKSSKAFQAPANAGEWWIFQGRGGSDKGVGIATSIVNADLYFYFDGLPSLGATGTLDIWTTYRIIDVS